MYFIQAKSIEDPSKFSDSRECRTLDRAITVFDEFVQSDKFVLINLYDIRRKVDSREYSYNLLRQYIRG